METLVAVAVVAALAYLAWKNKDKIKAKVESVLDRDDGMDEEPIAPETGRIAPQTGSIAPQPTVPETSKPPASNSKPLAYNGVGDPPSQEAWAAWLATLDPMTRSYYPAIWKPTAEQPKGSGDTFPRFKPISGNLVTDDVLRRGERALATGTLGVVMAFPVEPGATRVTISETSGTGDKVQYNLWVSDTPVGVPVSGVQDHSFQYNAATIIFTPSEKVLYANVRALVEGGRPFYIQAN